MMLEHDPFGPAVGNFCSARFPTDAVVLVIIILAWRLFCTMMTSFGACGQQMRINPNQVPIVSNSSTVVQLIPHYRLKKEARQHHRVRS